MRRPGRSGLFLEEIFGRARSRAVRLSEGQIWLIVADRAQGDERAAARSWPAKSAASPKHPCQRRSSTFKNSWTPQKASDFVAFSAYCACALMLRHKKTAVARGDARETKEGGPVSAWCRFGLAAHSRGDNIWHQLMRVLKRCTIRV